MSELLDRLGMRYRITVSVISLRKTETLEVAEACIKGGWLEIRDLRGLIRWLTSKEIV